MKWVVLEMQKRIAVHQRVKHKDKTGKMIGVSNLFLEKSTSGLRMLQHDARPPFVGWCAKGGLARWSEYYDMKPFF